MNKLSRYLYRKIMDDQQISKAGLHMLLWLIMRQRPDGWIYGVYYRDIVSDIGCSKSNVYVIRDYLEEKGYINWTKSSGGDMDIRVLDNVFQWHPLILPDYRDYLNINISMFRSDAFWRLPAGAIKTALYFYNRLGGQKGNKKIKDKDKLWIEDACKELSEDILKCQRRTAKKYLMLLQQSGCFNIGFSRSYDNKKTDVISLKEEASKQPIYFATHSGNRVEKKEYAERQAYQHFIRVLCRREAIKYEMDELSDTADLIQQYFGKLNDRIYRCVKEAILKLDGELNAKGTHKILIDIMKNEDPLTDT